MSDRPDRPPVWVRGGPPYIYVPPRQNNATGGEMLRRGSTTESIQSSCAIDTSSPPSSPGVAPAAASPPPPSSNFAASSTQTQSQDPQHARFRRSSSSLTSGKDLFTNLAFQKRTTNDASFATRRASWNEQRPGSGPDTVKFFGNWWDSFTKGSGQDKK